MRLGELLVQLRAITDDQLQEALNAQLIHGGHLGTCLIEREYISEARLGQVLAQVFDVRYAGTEFFDKISRAAIEALPASLVEKHHAVPLRVERSKLDVAMVDPSDLHAVDALSFASGRKIIPWVAPEVRILQAMDRYYGIARRMRYITLARTLDKDSDSGRCDLRVVFDREEPTRGDEIRGAVMAAARGSAAREPVRSAAAVADAERPPRTPGPDPLEPLAGLLCRVAHPAKLGEIVLDYTAAQLARSVLFEVNSGTAVLWDSRGLHLSDDRAREVSFPITGEPLFALLMGEGHYRGPVPCEPQYRHFYETLGIEPPAEMVLVPIYVEDRLVALFYGDDGDGAGIDETTSTFCRMGKKIGLALNLIQVKHQLRTV